MSEAVPRRTPTRGPRGLAVSGELACEAGEYIAVAGTRRAPTSERLAGELVQVCE